MQVIVTSYCRLKYLQQTLTSLRQDDVQLYVVDGGSDEETRDYIRRAADGAVFLEGNPGADVLKNTGVQKFVTEPEFIISSDDLVYPAGYSRMILEQYRKVNADRLLYTFVACNMASIEAHVLRHRFNWCRIQGVEVYPVETSQVAGAIVDRHIWEWVGGFPVYGCSGQGDWAFSLRLRRLGLWPAYWRQPMIVHVGQNKHQDYPEYSKLFDEDERRFIKLAKVDAHRSA